MKIGLLTMPPISNYGGIIQAYALQTVLQRMGNDVNVLNRQYGGYGDSYYQKYRTIAIRKVKSILGKEDEYERYQKPFEYVIRKPQEFVNKYLKLTRPLYLTHELKKEARDNQYDAYVVGSDQIWRPKYVTNIYNYYLDFVKDKHAKKMAYAVSFGVDSWEYSDIETEVCGRLAKEFDAISVREDSGVKMCEKYLGVHAQHVLDPTILLDKQDYIELINKEDVASSDGDMFCYILDNSETKTKFIERISDQTGKKPYLCRPKFEPTNRNLDEHIEDCVFPSIVQWLQSFVDAEMVIVDSFHGAVFSIIFNKPFWVIKNQSRGEARFASLLKQFELSERLISEEELPKDLLKPIDWGRVNSIKTNLKNESLDFIRKTLNS